MIRNKSLNLRTRNKQLAQEVIEQSARELQQLEKDVMGVFLKIKIIINLGCRCDNGSNSIEYTRK